MSERTVALFVTCLVDLFRPTVGFAAIRLLEQAGCRVQVPESQTCCGQPAYNSGDTADAATLARQVVDAFAGYDAVVVPSGSCAGMIRHHYPALLADDAAYGPRAAELAERTFELTQFLVDELGADTVAAAFEGTVVFHDSCSCRREMGVVAQPRALMAGVRGLTVAEPEGALECCGFGGSFSAQFPDISGRMVDDKCAALEATGAGTVAAADLGCLLNIAGRLKRRGSGLKARHVAEILAGMTDGAPSIGEGEAD